MEQQLVKFESGADYKDVAAVAKKLGIDYVGVRKPDLIAKVNSKIESSVTEDPSSTNGQAVVSASAEDNAGATKTEEGSENNSKPESQPIAQDSSTQQQPAKRGRKSNGTPKEPRAKKTKWYDEENANLPYAPGNIIEVHSGEILVGRKAQVVKMSAKKHAVKAILIHPVKGSLQGCIITLDYDKIQMAADQTPPKGANEEATEQLVETASQTADNKQTDNQVSEAV
ncbi:hypothetical protein D3C87_574070 [compost metagenome]